MKREQNPFPVAVRKLTAFEMRSIITHVVGVLWNEPLDANSDRLIAIANLLELYNLKPEPPQDAQPNP